MQAREAGKTLGAIRAERERNGSLHESTREQLEGLHSVSPSVKPLAAKYAGGGGRLEWVVKFGCSTTAAARNAGA